MTHCPRHVHGACPTGPHLRAAPPALAGVDPSFIHFAGCSFTAARAKVRCALSDSFRVRALLHRARCLGTVWEGTRERGCRGEGVPLRLLVPRGPRLPLQACVREFCRQGHGADQRDLRANLSGLLVQRRQQQAVAASREARSALPVQLARRGFVAAVEVEPVHLLLVAGVVWLLLARRRLCFAVRRGGRAVDTDE